MRQGNEDGAPRAGTPMMAMNSTGKEFFAVKKQKMPDAVNQNVNEDEPTSRNYFAPDAQNDLLLVEE